MNPQVIPLIFLPQGSKATLSRISAGVGLESRLAALGLTPGTELCVFQQNGGTLLIGVRDSRLAIGSGVAQKIMVEVLED
ncbi:MAG TPA: FeoA family protein [Anaerolineales bacterium]|nr:FeoA family protein [Anaerolineales bacterium]